MFIFARKKVLVILMAGSFWAAFVYALNWGDIFPKTVYEKEDISSRITERRIQNSVSKVPKKDEYDGFVFFMKRLQGKPSIDELEKLFEEVFYPENGYTNTSLFQQEMVVRKWGEVAPRQCFEKLKEMKQGVNFLFPLFSGWAGKDPDAAISFYEEKARTDLEFAKGRADMLKAIVSEYARFSPLLAWDWLLSHKDDILEKEFADSKYLFFRCFPLEHPELIPEFVKRVDVEEIGDNLYAMGVGWGESQAGLPEWIMLLPEENRAIAQAGLIMGESHGNLDVINKKLSQIPKENKIKVIRELADPVLDAGAVDMLVRVNWIIDSLPQSEIPNSVKGTVTSWFERNTEEAKVWIDGLPIGEKRELLQKWYDNRVK